MLMTKNVRRVHAPWLMASCPRRHVRRSLDYIGPWITLGLHRNFRDVIAKVPVCDAIPMISRSVKSLFLNAKLGREIRRCRALTHGYCVGFLRALAQSCSMRINQQNNLKAKSGSKKGLFTRSSTSPCRRLTHGPWHASQP